METWHFGCTEVEKIFAEFKEDLIKVGKKMLNNVGGKNVISKRWKQMLMNKNHQNNVKLNHYDRVRAKV